MRKQNSSGSGTICLISSAMYSFIQDVHKLENYILEIEYRDGILLNIILLRFQII